MTIGNIPEAARNRVEGKKLVGFIPSVKLPPGISEIEAREYKRYVHNTSLENMLLPIINNASGVFINYGEVEVNIIIICDYQ